MFQKEGNWGVAVDEEAGVRVDFNWDIDRGQDGYLLYQIIDGSSFALLTDIRWRRGFFLQRKSYHEVDLKYVLHVKDGAIVYKPPAPVSDEFRERIANDLLAAARCLKIHCELRYGDRRIA
jgi:hypothetical protein